jgi:hypothetical protein
MLRVSHAPRSESSADVFTLPAAHDVSEFG